MALRDFVFGFRFTATDYVSPVLRNIETRIEAVNAQVKATASWREGAGNIALVGGAFLGVGGAALLGLKSMVDAAAGMQTVMTHVQTAMNDGIATQKHLAQVQETSEKLAIASGLAATQEAQAYYIARSNMLDHAQAMAAVSVATKLTIGTTASLADAQAQLEPTTRLLTSIYQNFGDKSRDANAQIAGFADTLAKLQTQYAFRDISEVNYALSYAAPLAKSAGIAFNDMSAALATLSVSNKTGAEAGTAFAELVQKLSTESKLRGLVAHTARGGIDLEKTMEKLRAVTAGYTTTQEAMYLHQLGFTERSIVGVSLLIDKTRLYGSAVKDLGDAQGANAAAFAVRQASMEIATGRLSAAWDVLKSTIGENLLGPVTSVATMLTQAVGWMTALVRDHPQITKFVVTFTAIAAAIAVVTGGVIALVAGIAAVGSYMGIVAGAVWTFTEIGAAIAFVGAALATWNIGGFISSLHGSLAGIGDWINGLARTVWNFGGQMFAAGANLVKSIASGIWSAVTFPQRAIESVVTKIRAYLPFSPAREGPLRTLNRMRLVETIAETIRPGPALIAMRRTAAAMTIAAPMTFAPMMAAPALAMPRVASTLASPASPGARGGGIVIQVHQDIRIDGALAGDEQKLMATLRHHGEELAQIIDARLTHRARREL